MPIVGIAARRSGDPAQLDDSHFAFVTERLQIAARSNVELQNPQTGYRSGRESSNVGNKDSGVASRASVVH